MIDQVINYLDIILAITACAIFFAHRTDKKLIHVSLALMMVTSFLAGMAMITDSKSPWCYLLLTAGLSDWIKAIAGGLIIPTFCFGIYTLMNRINKIILI